MKWNGFLNSNSKYRFGLADVMVILMLLSIFYLTVHLGAGMQAPFSESNQPAMSLSPQMLPYYAGRSLLRMFIAFGASLLFTFIYGRIAAYNRVAEKIMIPAIDILQSVPVLGFLWQPS